MSNVSWTSYNSQLTFDIEEKYFLTRVSACMCSPVAKTILSPRVAEALRQPES